MKTIRIIRRYAAAAAVVAAAWLGLAVAAPAAFAQSGMIPIPTGGGGDDVPVPAVQTVTRIVVVGGMPGWQIALIAVGAALAAGTAAVLAYRMLTVRRQAIATA
jgi:hypothetical protein